MINKKKKIILIEDVEGLGKKNEVKEVNSSFATNFLLPNKKALLYNREKEKLKREEERKFKQKKLKEKEDLVLFEKIKGKKISFLLKKDKNKIFGSVRLFDILEKLKKEGLEINKKKFINFTPINREGTFLISLKINNKLLVNLEIEVKTNS